MRYAPTKLMLALLASAVMTADAYAQASYPCVNDAPNPYKLAANWAQTPRPFGPTNAVTVDSKDNVWVFDRCGDMGCSGSNLSPIYELSPTGKTMKNFGAGQFVSAHGVAVDKDGNVWAADFQAKDGKGMQVVKLSPDGKVLLKVGKAGEPGLGDDAFNAPTGVAVLSTGEILIAEGHGSKLNKSRVNVYDKTGKFLASWKQFGRPSGVWVDNNDMIYVADSQSAADPKEANYNGGCKMGIRVGSVKDGKVLYYIPPPPAADPKTPPPEGIAVDSKGNIYAAAVQGKDVKKYTK